MTLTWPKAGAIVLFLALGVFGAGRSFARTLFPDHIVLLREEDPVPAGAVLIQELRLRATSYADSCAWFELLLKGTRIASSRGANLVKILERNVHRRDGCDALDLAVYRVDSPRNADLAFRWSAERRLRWDDFTGRARAGAGEHVAAETSCGISVETSLAPASVNARIYVFNTFDKRQSWVRTGQASDAVLRHEQGHWDLCELYTRRMQARFDAQSIHGSRLNELVNRIYEAVEQEYVRRQDAYERDTRHGLDSAAQQRWERIIAAELGRVSDTPSALFQR